MRKVLVTGGKGFLGSKLVARLIQDGEQVRVFARAEKGQAEQKGGNPEYVYGDIRNAREVDEAVNGSDVVMHLVSNFRKGGSDKEEAHSVNVEGTENVLNSACRHKVRRVIHCSTIGVHGDVREIPANEETAYNPGDLYQETKVISEKLVWKCHEETKLPITMIRPMSLYGPGDLRMLKLFKMIKNGQFMFVGKGEVFFQPAYIDDVVKGFLLCLDKEEAIGNVFIVGGEQYLPLKKLVSVIAQELDVPVPHRHIPMKPALLAASLCEKICVPLGIEPPLHRRRMSFFQNNRAYTIEKAKRVLGFQPEVGLQDGIRRTIKWYEEQGWL